jgi:hypothetical protein
MHIDDFFTDIIAYVLTLDVAIPAQSGFAPSMLHSPQAILGRYEGLCSDDDAPEWTQMIPGRLIKFRQPRGAMAEVFGTLALWTENQAVVSEILNMLA